jgi:SAM-dependent methyltransferase
VLGNYASMEAIVRAGDGTTVLDVPCGGGVAFRALRPDQRVRYLAADISEAMLARARHRARERGLDQIEFVRADLCRLPFEDGVADLCVSYSGLHCVARPDVAVAELVRCMGASESPANGPPDPFHVHRLERKREQRRLGVAADAVAVPVEVVDIGADDPDWALDVRRAVA